MKKGNELGGTRGNRDIERSMKKFKERQRREKVGENGNGNTLDVELQHKLAAQLTTLHAQKQQLFMDNQFLTQEVLKFKQEIRQLNQEIASLKKYVHFLQTYNQDLKQEMAVRVKRPRNMHAVTVSELDPHVLAREIQHLRRLNDFKESELKMLERANYGHTQSNQDRIASKSKIRQNITPKKSVSFLQKDNIHYNSSKLKKPKPKTKQPHFPDHPTHFTSHNCPFHFPPQTPSDFLY